MGGAYNNTARWSFYGLQNIVLPSPVITENFDSYTEGTAPTGWTAWNFTDCSGAIARPLVITWTT